MPASTDPTPAPDGMPLHGVPPHGVPPHGVPSDGVASVVVPGPPPAARTWTLCLPGGAAADVEVTAPDSGLLADVLGPLSAALGRPAGTVWAGPEPLAPETPLTDEALRHGAVLGLGAPAPPDPADAPSGALELHLVGGPDAGRTIALGQGTLVVGRGSDCGLTVADPDVSRRHATVSVAGGRVTVADLSSSNGSTLTVDAAPAVAVGTTPREWPVGGVLRLGASALRLTAPAGARLAQLAGTGGRRVVRPLPTPLRLPAPVEVVLPTPPAGRSPRRLGWVAVTLPAAAGLAMAWLFSAPQFLFFALLGPLVAVAGWASDRVSGRRADRRDTAEHAAARARATVQLDAALAAHRTALEEQQPDVALLAAAARRRSSPLWSRDVRAGLTVRLGTGSAPTAVTTVGPDRDRSPVVADDLPVTLSLGTTSALGVIGPREPAAGTVRALVCQLAALMPPAQLHLVLVCDPGRTADWRWMRWLPHLREVHVPGAAAPTALTGPATAGRPADAPALVVVVDGPVGPDVAGLLRAASGRLVRLELAGGETALSVPTPALLEVAGETGTTGRLRVPGAGPDALLALDGVSRSTAGLLARQLAGVDVPAGPDELPDAARLLDLPTQGLQLAADGRTAGTWDRRRDRLLAVLGTTGRETVRIDLVADGPHALVAGTTGSGKSELLQTLVAGLALHHPPDRCSFLLVDYKGGAAFGEAAALPHSVGVLTDLDPQSTARALRSLTAELTRRERLLADHRVRDLADLPDSALLARLVIVVDEFATLAEELPGFVTGLVGIAQRGRSLGVHLVLATQRPSGVVSPEIRSNCSLRICLRTTDEADARDVLGSPAAASLPSDRPGRGYVRVGSAAPLLVQLARVSGSAQPDGPAVTVRPSPWPRRPDPPAPAPVTAPLTDLQRTVAALVERARSEHLQRPDSPWLPPLPDRLEAGDLDRWGPRTDPARVRIGVRDDPDAQSQTPLELDLAAGGGWLLTGGPRSGRTTALRTVLTEAVRQLTPDQLHVHVLDHGGGVLARQAAALPHCGTAVGRDDAHRSVRLIARLVEEVDRRRAGPTAEPLVLVLVDGHEALAAQLEEADPATGGAGLLRLVRDGAAVGVTVVLTSDRAVPGSRLTGAVRVRLVLPLPEPADYAVAGVPVRAVPGHRPPGRALLPEGAVECQLALPRQGLRIDGARRSPGATAPILVPPLPADPELPLPTPGDRSPDVGLRVLLGLGGDEAHPVPVDLERAGGLLVVGPPGSGRSTTLRALARHCRALGADVLHLGDHPVAGPPDGPLHGAVDGAGDGAPDGAPDGQAGVDRVGRADVAALRAWLAGQDPRRSAVVVADDLVLLPDAVSDVLTPLVAPTGRLLLLAAGTAADLAGHYRGPAVALRRSRTALLLRPSPGDAELLGLRTPRTPLPLRPGAGWLVSPAGATRVQVARHRRAP